MSAHTAAVRATGRRPCRPPAYGKVVEVVTARDTPGMRPAGDELGEQIVERLGEVGPVRGQRS